MTWMDVTRNWNTYLRALAQWFPHVDTAALGAIKGETGKRDHMLAKSHDLTIDEAREALDDFLFVQGLARDTADIRRHDAA